MLDAIHAPCLGTFHKSLYVGQEVDARDPEEGAYTAAYIISFEEVIGDEDCIGRGGGPPTPPPTTSTSCSLQVEYSTPSPSGAYIPSTPAPLGKMGTPPQ